MAEIIGLGWDALEPSNAEAIEMMRFRVNLSEKGFRAFGAHTLW